MNKDLHPVQASILRELLFKNGSTFSALNKTGMGNDNFSFHLRQLTVEGVIEKRVNKYFLTQEGKLFANKLDIFSLKMEKFGTPSVAVTAKKVVGGTSYYLIQQRLKEPLYGYHGFINGKVKFGELVEETASRELLEEAGISGDEPEIMTIHHWLRGPTRNHIKLDHYFFICLVKNPKGKLKSTKEGKNYWMTEEEIKKLKTFPGFDHSLKTVVSEKPQPFIERYIKVDEI